MPLGCWNIGCLECLPGSAARKTTTGTRGAVFRRVAAIVRKQAASKRPRSRLASRNNGATTKPDMHLKCKSRAVRPSDPASKIWHPPHPSAGSALENFNSNWFRLLFFLAKQNPESKQNNDGFVLCLQMKLLACLLA